MQIRSMFSMSEFEPFLSLSVPDPNWLNPCVYVFICLYSFLLFSKRGVNKYTDPELYYYTSGMLNGLHGTIGTVNGTLNGLHGTIRTVNGTLNGLHVRFERRTQRWTVCTERFERRTVGTLWPRFKKIHFGNSRCLLLPLLLFRYLFICWIINTNYLLFKKKYKSAISGPILIISV
jgi:hypothetical protein